MSYFEIETQLLTFRKDLLPYEFVYHFISCNRNGSKKVKGGERGVQQSGVEARRGWKVRAWETQSARA